MNACWSRARVMTFPEEPKLGSGNPGAACADVTKSDNETASHRKAAKRPKRFAVELFITCSGRSLDTATKPLSPASFVLKDTRAGKQVGCARRRNQIHT